MSGRRVLVIGGGGREHALAWKLGQSAAVERVWCAPGNGAIADADRLPVSATDVDGIVRAAKALRVDLVVVGPEAPLVEGLVDRLAEAGIAAFGPTAACAKLEGSKAFSKDFMTRCEIPTAAYGTFSEVEPALQWLEEVPFNVVVKASGLAAGKGVIVCEDKAQAAEAIRDMLDGGAFGGAGAEIVVEERLEGQEVSLLAFCDGETYRLMPPAQDHKRIGEGDVGPNTGGMGAYAPAPVAIPQLQELGESTIAPILKGFAAEGTPFKGVLFAGLMLTPHGVRVLEYNCRFGDPETQVVLPLLKGDLHDIMMACVEGTLDEQSVDFHPGSAATVVAASAGYPKAYEKGKTIEGVAEADALDDVQVFQAGTKADHGHLVTSGGRVLAITGVGDHLKQALDRAYQGISKVCFEGITFRRDIGHRALAGDDNGRS